MHAGEVLLRGLDWFIPALVSAEGTDATRRARLLIGIAWLGAVTELSAAAFGLAVNPEIRIQLAVMGSAQGLVPLLLRWTGALFLASSVLISILLGHTIFLAAVAGELAVFPGWLVPLFAVLLQGARAGVVWSVLTFASVAGIAVATSRRVALPVPDVDVVASAGLRGAFALIFVSLMIGLAYEWLKNHALREMDDAQHRADAAHGKQIETERRFRTLTDNAADVISEWDSRGRVLYISPQITAITGHPPETFLGDGWEQRVDAAQSDELERFRATLRRGLDTGDHIDVSFRFQHRDGGWRWMELTAAPFHAEDGAIHFVSVSRDVTERREAEALRKLSRQLQETISERERGEAALRDSEERYRIVVETATDTIVTIDDSSKIVFVNSAALELFGYTPAELTDQSLTILMPEALTGPHRAALARYVETGRRSISWHGIALTGRHKTGREFPIEISFGEQIRDGRRLLTGIVRDVSERKRYQKRLEEAAADLSLRNTELAHANRELEEFTSVAWHDLQEPLRRMISFTSLLREDVGRELPPDAERDIEFIAGGAYRMQQLVEDLLKLSRAGAMALQLELLQVDDCVDQALEDLELRIGETRARIERAPLPELSADRALLTSVYRNLIGNSLKFAGGAAPAIRLTAELGEQGVVLGVLDQGMGVPPEESEEIFKPFRRLAAESEGTGIGLAMCRKAVERHKGRIWVESPPGQGAHFRFTLTDGR